MNRFGKKLINQRFICPGEFVNENFLSNFRLKRPASVFREAVRHQHRALHENLAECLGTYDFSLDHYPVPFAVLKYVFLKLQEITPIELTREHLTEELLRDWQYFHGYMAEYRVVDKKLNSKLGQKFADYWLSN